MARSTQGSGSGSRKKAASERDTGGSTDGERPEGREEGAGPARDMGDTDVFLDVPVVKVDEIELEVENLLASVSLEAEVLDLLKLKVGADVGLGRVQLTIKGVEAQALLKVRLDNVRDIIARVLETIDANPQILEQVTRGVGSSLEKVAGGTGEAVGAVGKGAGSAVEDVGQGAGSAVEDVGSGAGGAVRDVGSGAGKAVEGVGEETGETLKEAGRAAGSAVKGGGAKDEDEGGGKGKDGGKGSGGGSGGKSARGRGRK